MHAPRVRQSNHYTHRYGQSGQLLYGHNDQSRTGSPMITWPFPLTIWPTFTPEVNSIADNISLSRHAKTEQRLWRALKVVHKYRRLSCSRFWKLQKVLIFVYLILITCLFPWLNTHWVYYIELHRIWVHTKLGKWNGYDHIGSIWGSQVRFTSRPFEWVGRGPQLALLCGFLEVHTKSIWVGSMRSTSSPYEWVGWNPYLVHLCGLPEVHTKSIWVGWAGFARSPFDE